MECVSPLVHTALRDLSRRYTSTISASMRSLVTADNRARAALTIELRFTEEHGSSANSDDDTCIVSPVSKSAIGIPDKHQA